MKEDQIMKGIAQQFIDGKLNLEEMLYALGGNEKLTEDQKSMVNQAIADCRNHGAWSKVFGKTGIRGRDGEEAFAYPHSSGCIVWGFIGGEEAFCLARGLIE